VLDLLYFNEEDNKVSINRAEYEEYTIKQGEGLMAIARKLYNDPNKYREFRDEHGNPIANPDRVQAGQKILVPKRGGPGKPSDKYEEYTIKQGEGLMAIARNLYGDPNKYKEFRDEHGNPIANPDRVQAGQKILVPKEGRRKS
jgi:nucleoid-associated protein YgaU